MRQGNPRCRPISSTSLPSPSFPFPHIHIHTFTCTHASTSTITHRKHNYHNPYYSNNHNSRNSLNLYYIPSTATTGRLLVTKQLTCCGAVTRHSSASEPPTHIAGILSRTPPQHATNLFRFKGFGSHGKVTSTHHRRPVADPTSNFALINPPLRTPVRFRVAIPLISCIEVDWNLTCMHLSRVVPNDQVSDFTFGSSICNCSRLASPIICP